MESPSQRVGKYLQELNDSVETQRPTIIAKANIQSAIEISEALTGLKVAVNSTADRVVTAVNHLKDTLEKTNPLTENAAAESGKLLKKARAFAGN